MHNDIIILGGNTSNNIKWLRQMVNVYKKNYNVFSLFFDNWEDNSMIDFEKEGKKLRQLCKGKKNYVIIAKSAGAVLAAIEIEKNNITPSIFVVLGLPLKFTFENRIKIKEILNNIMQMKEKTIINIANKVTDVKDMDKIYLMVDGKFVDNGTHDELLSRNSIYQEMYQYEMAGELVD